MSTEEVPPAVVLRETVLSPINSHAAAGAAAEAEILELVDKGGIVAKKDVEQLLTDFLTRFEKILTDNNNNNHNNQGGGGTNRNSSSVPSTLLAARERVESQARGIDGDVNHVSSVEPYIRCIPCCGPYFANRYMRSTLLNFLEGVNLTSDDVDSTVNNITLVQALLLTIPPGIMTSLGGTDVWDTLEQGIASCGIPNTEHIWLENVYNPIWRSIAGSYFCCLLGIALSLIYFVLRPKGVNHFFDQRASIISKSGGDTACTEPF